MESLLVNCFYDGMTIKEAQEFIERCYGKKPTAKQIEKVSETIEQNTNVKWG